MKRYFISCISAAFAVMALSFSAILVSAPVSQATEIEPWALSYQLDDHAMPLDIYRVTAVQIVHDEGGTGLDTRRTVPSIAPEYAESLKTDALNFIETRLRC